ncbi:MAG: rhodanese-like domain-containing protein [Methanothrix sp.]|nr:MAG: rhodanese-like domain-containing protein [Methanothrix sp.]
MSGKESENHIENKKSLADAKGSIIEKLHPSDCRVLVQRFSGESLPEIPPCVSRLVILDVRTPQEYSSGHLKDSINLDFRSPSFLDELARLDRNNVYLVYCRTGIRSGRCVQHMGSMGFRYLYDMAGGLIEWRRVGYEVV